MMTSSLHIKPATRLVKLQASTYEGIKTIFCQQESHRYKNDPSFIHSSGIALFQCLYVCVVGGT